MIDIPKICGNCKYLHGKNYNDNLLVCGMHPYGNGEKCSDFELQDKLGRYEYETTFAVYRPNVQFIEPIRLSFTARSGMVGLSDVIEVHDDIDNTSKQFRTIRIERISADMIRVDAIEIIEND